MGWLQISLKANAGGAGASTADVITPTCVDGKIVLVQVDFHGGGAAGIVCTIKTQGNHAPSYNILTNTGNTNLAKTPTVPMADQTGAAVTYDGTHPLRLPVPVDDHIEVTLASANSNDLVDVYLLLE
jgi:hypothetical protein